MWRILTFDGDAFKINFKVSFKCVDSNVLTILLHRKEVITLHMSVFETEPMAQKGFGLGREEHDSVSPSFCDFRS